MSLITANMALNKCVINVAPFFAARSAMAKSAVECPVGRKPGSKYFYTLHEWYQLSDGSLEGGGFV
jgi:hypothetical protein